MCTLTFTDPRRPREAGPGYRVLFNRDERRTRGPERPPALELTPDGTRYLAPTDSDAGGTWILVNEFGVTVALLNGYRDPAGPRRDAYRSRGELVRSLADLRTARESWARLGPRDLAPFRPAVVAVFAPGEAALLFRWDGCTVGTVPDAVSELPVSSSSHAQDEVQRHRRALFRELVGPRPGDAEVQALERFQWWTDPDRGATALTPLMARSDASTRSAVVIDVGRGGARMDYEPHPEGGAARRWRTLELPVFRP